MAYLLTNAARLRASQNHAEHHVWGLTREEFIERMKFNKTSDGVHAYNRVLRDPSSIDHKFDPNCEQCEYKRREREEGLRREAEEQEKYRIRHEEEKAKKKEKDREAAERRMMAAEDKPRTPPPKPKSSLTPEQIESLARYNKEKDELERQKEEVDRKIREMNIPANDIAKGLTYCKHCDIKFAYRCQMYAHIETRSHKMKAGMLETYPKTCDACEYTAKTRHKWEQHCEGAKHKIRMEGGQTKTSCEKCGVVRNARYDWEKHKCSYLCVHWRRQKRWKELIASGMDKKTARDKAWNEIQHTDDEVQTITIPTTELVNISNEAEVQSPSSTEPLTNE
jgi:hypothetical protein